MRGNDSCMRGTTFKYCFCIATCKLQGILIVKFNWKFMKGMQRDLRGENLRLKIVKTQKVNSISYYFTPLFPFYYLIKLFVAYCLWYCNVQVNLAQFTYYSDMFGFSDEAIVYE